MVNLSKIWPREKSSVPAKNACKQSLKPPWFCFRVALLSIIVPPLFDGTHVREREQSTARTLLHFCYNNSGKHAICVMEIGVKPSCKMIVPHFLPIIYQGSSIRGENVALLLESINQTHPKEGIAVVVARKKISIWSFTSKRSRMASRASLYMLANRWRCSCCFVCELYLLLRKWGKREVKYCCLGEKKLEKVFFFWRKLALCSLLLSEFY